PNTSATAERPDCLQPRSGGRALHEAEGGAEGRKDLDEEVDDTAWAPLSPCTRSLEEATEGSPCAEEPTVRRSLYQHRLSQDVAHEQREVIHDEMPQFFSRHLSTCFRSRAQWTKKNGDYEQAKKARLDELSC
ncbi:hypothetical protein CSUI_006020, partial [Cystoisospora suis]